jgi:hypothetical protein
MQEEDAHCSGVLGGDVGSVVSERIFWCEVDQLALIESSDVLLCTTCGTMMERIGWREEVK